MVMTPLAANRDIATPLAESPPVAADWWDPDNEGLSVIGAYRAINSVGTPWSGGPANYAESLVNQANPGTFDLVEGNGAVPWAAATGWGFVAAALQYFDTVGVIPNAGWSALIQFANAIVGSLYAVDNLGPVDFGIRSLAASVTYQSGGARNVAPQLATGNLGVAGQQGYRNGIAEGTPIGAWGGVNALAEFIGCSNSLGAPANYNTADIESIVFYDATNTGPQMLAVATAMGQL